jgi:hypothetical protein
MHQGYSREEIGAIFTVKRCDFTLWSLFASHLTHGFENHMTYDLPISKKTVCGIVGVAAILFYLWLLTWAGPAHALPSLAATVPSPQSQVEQAKIYQRGRTPIYPYVSSGPGPRGWTGYFGFVPYTKGNIENEALQRNFYPMNTWPHDPNAPPPQPWGVGN